MTELTQKNPFEALLQISTELNDLHDSHLLLDKVLDIAMETIQAERGFIVLRLPEKQKDFEVVTARKISKETISDTSEISTSTVKRVLDEGKSVLTYDAITDSRFTGADSIQLQQIRSIACVPLGSEDSIIGAIYMDNRSNAGRFDEANLDFLKAFSHQAAIAVKNAQLYEGLQKENRQLREQVYSRNQFPEMIGDSKKMNDLLETINSIADSEATVLIEGESGTGKELVAKAIHAHSRRSEKPFIPIFCGSLSESLLESELFGHKKGAFTGATENKPGLFEDAHGGSLFLDEIGEISAAMQVKLLRVLQEGETKRVGDNRIQRIDVRIIAATNKNMSKLVNSGEFREDLYYRLNVIKMTMPPLRERKEDIPLLARHFLKIYSEKNKKYLKGIDAKAKQHLVRHKWPGNIRELENTIERAVIMAKDQYIKEADLQLTTSPEESVTETGGSLKEFQKNYVLKILRACQGNRTKCAEELKVSRRWLQYQLKDWGIEDEHSGL
jgi:Nif-specific regulatory protein